MYKGLSIALLLVTCTCASAQRPLLDQALFDLPDVRFEYIEDKDESTELLKLMVRQPLDHEDESKGHFYQKVYLTHRDFDAPTVIATEGYDRSRNRMYEVTELLGANQVLVEHRFCGESLPDSMDYTYLDLKQATADLHHVRVLIGEMYSGKWISTGISKGGATAIFYRYFYPEDVSASVPYVAPINREFEDQRLYDFLNSVGSQECRDDIRGFQEFILSRRDQVLPLLEFYNLGTGARYTYLSLEEAFELSVLEYPFSFWQYGQDCSKIPDAETSISEAVKYLISISDMQFFSDEQIEAFGSHYYQSAEEMGYYGYETSTFDGFLQVVSTETNPHATFLPGKMEVPFDGTLLKEVNKWLQTDAHHMLYINGALDTWSATGVPENDHVDSEWFVLEGKHHANARISGMTKDERNRFIAALERWLDMEIE